MSNLIENEPSSEPSSGNFSPMIRLAREESGSISILIIFLFLLTLVISFAIIDISGAFLAKRELINIAEPAISRAAHNVDLNRYYSGDRVQVGSNSNGPVYLLPIDCQAAATTLEAEISQTTLHGSPINISQFTCQSDLIRATIQSIIPPTLTIPFISGGANNASTTNGSTTNGMIQITATVSASNPIG